MTGTMDPGVLVVNNRGHFASLRKRCFQGVQGASGGVGGGLGVGGLGGGLGGDLGVSLGVYEECSLKGEPGREPHQEGK